MEVALKSEDESKLTHPSTPEESVKSFRESKKQSTSLESYLPIDQILHNLVSDPKAEHKRTAYAVPGCFKGQSKTSALVKMKPKTAKTRP